MSDPKSVGRIVKVAGPVVDRLRCRSPAGPNTSGEAYRRLAGVDAG